MKEIVDLFNQLDDSAMLVVRKSHIENALEFELSERIAGDRWQVKMICSCEFLSDPIADNVVFNELVSQLKNH